MDFKKGHIDATLQELLQTTGTFWMNTCIKKKGSVNFF